MLRGLRWLNWCVIVPVALLFLLNLWVLRFWWSQHCPWQPAAARLPLWIHVVAPVSAVQELVSTSPPEAADAAPQFVEAIQLQPKFKREVHLPQLLAWRLHFDPELLTQCQFEQLLDTVHIDELHYGAFQEPAAPPSLPRPSLLIEAQEKTSSLTMELVADS